MECILASIFDTNGFWDASWEAKWTKNRSKKALEKGIDFSLVFAPNIGPPEPNLALAG